MKPRVVVAAPNQTRARLLADPLKELSLEVDVAVGGRAPRPMGAYRLLIADAAVAPERLIARLAPDAHVVVLMDTLEASGAARYLQEPRVSHLLGGQSGPDHLPAVVQKLATGNIFGLDWYLPAEVTIEYRRLNTFKQRCDTLEALEQSLKSSRVRGSIAQSATRVLEELLMNAMYQAPFEDGRRVFADVDPKQRVRKKTPRPVSVRYAIHQQRVFLCVRDRYGSFHRDDLARCLLRCTTSDVQIEEKRLGAGLGLYLITSTVRGLIINILPGMVSEFICVISSRGLHFQTVEFTANELDFWRRAVRFANELRPEFEAEGAHYLFWRIIAEAEHTLETLTSGIGRRYLFRVNRG